METLWLAPYVRASVPNLLESQGFGESTVSWFDENGRLKQQAVVAGINPGFLTLLNSPLEVVQGVNEDWKITLPADPSQDGSITSTPDSRVFVHERHPQPESVALDIYIHGKLASALGPFLEYGGSGVELNDDGSTALLVWKDAAHTTAQVVAAGPDGAVRFQVDCGQSVASPIVAPDAAGMLLSPNTGGADENTFIWFTRDGKKRSLAINPNPECVGWIPHSIKSLFSTSLGYDYRYQLIDWNTGKSLWDIPCPGGENSQALAIAFTPKLVIFAVAELYKSGPWKGAEWVFRNNGKEWIRAFYAVSAQDGSLVARWQAQDAQRLDVNDSEHFLWLGDKLFYVTSTEFAELNLADIVSKKNGWK